MRFVNWRVLVLLCGFGPVMAWVDVRDLLPRTIQAALWAIAIPGACASWIGTETKDRCFRPDSDL